MNTKDLKGVALDWAVAKCLGYDQCFNHGTSIRIPFSKWPYTVGFSPTLDWGLSGKIIEEERIELEHDGFEWWARIKSDDEYSGPTLLIAAMRCFVGSKLGDEVSLPEDIEVSVNLERRKSDEST